MTWLSILMTQYGSLDPDLSTQKQTQLISFNRKTLILPFDYHYYMLLLYLLYKEPQSDYSLLVCTHAGVGNIQHSMYKGQS